MTRYHLIVILSFALIGCSPDSYQRAADLHVDRLLADRTKQTLEYQPQTQLPADSPAPVPKKAYERIPLSPVAPPTTPPIEPQHVEVPWEPLGPEASLKDAAPLSLDDFVLQLARRRAQQQAFLGPPAPGTEMLQLDLFGCLEYAVQHSRGYQDEMEQLYLSALDVTLQRHLFAPRPFARTGINYSGGQADVQYRSAYTVSNSVGVRQKLPYGGEIVAQTLVDFVHTLGDNADNGEDAALVLSGSMPLLRGFGMVNLEPLISSERELVYQVRGFEEFRRSFVVEIASRYFNLLALQQGVLNRRLSVQTFAQLTERTQALYAASVRGRLERITFLDVQRSLQSWLQAEASLITTEDAYRTALDNFKQVLGMPVDEPLDVAASALDVNVPTLKEEQAVALALKYRLSLKTAEDRVADAQRGVKNSQNGLLPDLALTAEGRVGNRTDDAAIDVDQRTLTYKAGVTLDIPLDRVAERNAYRSSLISLQRTQRSYGAVKDRIIADVRDALRAIRTAELAVEIQRRGIDLAEKRLEYSNELLKQGTINARDAVEAQNSLLDAQDQYEIARSQLQIRVLEFMRDTGTLRVDPDAGALGRAMERDKAK